MSGRGRPSFNATAAERPVFASSYLLGLLCLLCLLALRAGSADTLRSLRLKRNSTTAVWCEGTLAWSLRRALGPKPASTILQRHDYLYPQPAAYEASCVKYARPALKNSSLVEKQKRQLKRSALC